MREMAVHDARNGRSRWTETTVHDVAKSAFTMGRSMQPDGILPRGRRQMHVTHRRRQVGMTGQLLDGPRRRSAHRQMRAERLAKNVEPTGRAKPCPLLRSFEQPAQKEARHGVPVVAEENVLPAQVTVCMERVHERVGQRHDARPAALRRVGDALVSLRRDGRGSDARRGRRRGGDRVPRGRRWHGGWCEAARRLRLPSAGTAGARRPGPRPCSRRL